jgi:hypothetical protein
MFAGFKDKEGFAAFAELHGIVSLFSIDTELDL